MKRVIGILVVLFGAGQLNIDSAGAATIYYSNQSAWTSAVSGITTETYESYGWNEPAGDVLASNGSVTLGGITYSSTQTIYGVNSDIVTYDANYLSGKYLEWQFSPNDMTITLPNPVNAIAFKYGEFFGGDLDLSVYLGNGDSTTVGAVSGSYAFFGAVSDTAFSSFTLNADRNFIIIDDLSQAGSSAPVPEPSTMLLLGSGLVGLVGYGRRKFKK